MSPTKQARGDSSKEPKLPSVTEWRKKPWEKPDSVGGQFSSGHTNQQVVPCCSKFRLCRGLIWFLWSCPDGCLEDKVFTGDLSQGLIYLSWSLLTFRAVEVISRSWSTIWTGYRLDLGDCSDHLIWIQTGSGGYGDLRIRKKQTNISVDAILLTM